jgi:hypothetical protein
MRKLFLPLLFLLAAIPANATITLVQHPNNRSCASATTCTVTLTQATGSGNLLIISGSFYSPSSTTHITGISAGGSYVEGTNCPAYYSGVAGGVSCGYVLSSTGGVSSITVTYTNGNATTGYTALFIWEYHTTLSSWNYSVSGTNTDANASPAPGVGLTLTGGTNYVIAQVIVSNQAVTAISGSYTNPADINSVQAAAGAMGVSSGTAPNWTVSSNAYAAVSAIAFYESGSVSPNMPPAVY